MGSRDLANATGVHCWARTERIVEDLRTCLERYECRAGGNVSWPKFDRLQEKEKAGKLNKNPTAHTSCTEYFDEETEALVRKHDSLMFGFFEPAFWQPQRCCHA
ncbi:unnamed protein product [Prorocentrum cordatum]|uniref:Uncharacterized protein n=1 Tax=Prorocentrum cordatum TaxID=2364126 RepID=A0ABN9QSR3_9DINO|nr:unnamed protein product [Polarella glacialis]